MKKLLGTLSPVYGMATGEGMFGEAVGARPAIAKKCGSVATKAEAR